MRRRQGARLAVLALLLVSLPSLLAQAPLQEQADTLREQIQTAREAGDYARAAALARELDQLTRNNSGFPLWEAQLAARTSELLSAIAALPEQDRRRLATADRITPSIQRAQEEGREREVVPQAEEQVEIFRSLLGDNHLETGRSRLRLANLYKAMGQLRPAEPLHRSAESTIRSVLGAETPDATEALTDLADCLQKQGRYADAEPLFREALRIDRKLRQGIHPDVAIDLNNLGLLLQLAGRYDDAEPIQREALDMFRQLWGAEDPGTARVLAHYGMLLRAKGDWVAAEMIYREALAIRSGVLGKDHPGLVHDLARVGFILAHHGDYQGALDLFTEALELARRAYGNDHPDIAGILNDLAGVYCGQGDLDAAERSYREALAMQRRICGPEHPRIAQYLNNLADLLREKGDPSGALELHKEVLAMRESLLGPAHPDCAASLSLIGILCQYDGAYAEAEEYMRRALFIREQALGATHPLTIAAMTNLGSCLADQNRLAEAEAMLDRAADGFETARLRVGEGLGSAQVLLSPYLRLAGLRLARGEDAQAWDAAERGAGRLLADLLVRSHRRVLDPVELAREDSLRRALGDCERQLAYFRQEAATDPSGPAAAEASVVRGRLMRTEAELGAFRLSIAERYPAIAGQSYTLRQVQAVLRPDRAVMGWVENRALRSDSTLYMWAYVVRQTGPVRWVKLTAQGSQGPLDRDIQRLRRALCVPPDPLGPSPEREIWARKLYDRLMAPVDEALAGVQELVVVPTGCLYGFPLEVLIGPDERSLAERFSILYSPSATVYTQITEQARLDRSRRAAGVTALIVGDPVYSEDQATVLEQLAVNDAQDPGGGRKSATYTTSRIERSAGAAAQGTELRRGEPLSLQDDLTGRRLRSGDPRALARLPRLSGSRREAIALGRLLGDRAHLILGPEASEQGLIARIGTLRQYRILHFATHALTDDNCPDNSALILCQVGLPDPRGAIERGERLFDGRCTAGEILEGWELNADLVVLSGCETALGRTIPGEGYVGFAHAFFQAGARNLILSLWQVDDESTALLMERLYAHLLGEGENNAQSDMVLGERRIAEALAAAKHDVSRFTTGPGQYPYADPWYWAGFILVGGGD